MIRNLILLISCGFILVSGGCKKQHIERHYTGNFLFTNHYTSWDINGNSSDTTIISHGNVSLYDNPNADGQSSHPVFLKILYSTTSYLVVEVNKDGNFVKQTYLHGEMTGRFSDDDHLQFSHTDGGLGGTSTIAAIGVRE